MPISDYIKGLREKIGTGLLLVPGVTAIIFNERREVLLHRATDDGKWYTIGGAMDPGEDPADAAVRETFEETGLRVVPTRGVGVYADPVVVYANGDRVIYVSTCFECGGGGGPPGPGEDESLELRY